jgi:hypothetical protein
VCSSIPVDILGRYSGKLSNDGEKIALQLLSPLDAAILRFEHNDRWYPGNDGGGYSLTIADSGIQPAGWGLPESWLPAVPSPGR